MLDRAPPLLRLRAIQGWVHPNEGSAVGTDVVLVGAELATLRSDTLELLLGGSVCISDVHEKTLLANTNTIELSDDVVANIAVFKAARV